MRVTTAADVCVCGGGGGGGVFDAVSLSKAVNRNLLAVMIILNMAGGMHIFRAAPAP